MGLVKEWMMGMEEQEQVISFMYNPNKQPISEILLERVIPNGKQQPTTSTNNRINNPR